MNLAISTTAAQIVQTCVFLYLDQPGSPPFFSSSFLSQAQNGTIPHGELAAAFFWEGGQRRPPY